MKEIIANPAIRLRNERMKKESYRGLKRVYQACIVGLKRFFGARPKSYMEQVLSWLETDPFMFTDMGLDNKAENLMLAVAT